MVRPRVVRLDAAPSRGVSLASKRSISDEELVERVGGGQRWAEEALFRRYVGYITDLSYRLLRDRTEAEDVVQETFLDTFAALHRGDRPTSLRAWIAGVAVHKVHRRFRTRRFRALLGRASSVDDVVLAACAKPSASPEIVTELGLLDSVLKNVADVDRAAWLLRHVEGYGLEDVARLSGCSVTTTKRRLRRASAVVNAHLDVDCEGPDD